MPRSQRISRTIALLALALTACSPAEPEGASLEASGPAPEETSSAEQTTAIEASREASAAVDDSEPIPTAGSGAAAPGENATAGPNRQPETPVPTTTLVEAIGSCPADALSINLVRPARVRELSSIADILAPSRADGDLDAALLGLLSRGLERPLAIPVDRIRLGQASFVGWCSRQDGEPTLFIDAAAVASPPAEGGRPVALSPSVRMMQSNGVVYIGRARELDDMAARRTANNEGVPHPMVTPLASADGWDSLVDGAVGWTIHRPLENEPWLEWADGAPVLLSLNRAGRIDVIAPATTETSLSNALGRAQSWASAAVGQWQRTWSSEARPLGAWLNRLQQSAFEGIAITSDDTIVHLTIQEPACPGIHRMLVQAGTLITLVGASSVDDALGPRAFTPPNPQLQTSCPPAATTGGLNTRLARVAPDPGRQPAVLVLFDVSGMASSLLPSLGGLWPSALTNDAMREAGGPAPLGLDGWNDPDGDGVFYMEPVTGRKTLVLYPGGRTLLEGNAAILGGQLVTLSNRMVARTDDVAHVELRLNQSAETSLWEEFAGLGQPTTLGAVLLTPIILTPILTRAGSESALQRVVSGGPLVGMAIDAATGLEFWLPPAPAGTATDDGIYRQAVRELLTGAMGTGNMTLSPALERTTESIMAMVDELSVERSDQGVRVHWTQANSAWARSLSTTLLVAAPVLGNALPETDLSGISERMNAAPLRLPPGMVTPVVEE